jgi:hypothetical protein
LESFFKQGRELYAPARVKILWDSDVTLSRFLNEAISETSKFTLGKGVTMKYKNQKDVYAKKP